MTVIYTYVIAEANEDDEDEDGEDSKVKPGVYDGDWKEGKKNMVKVDTRTNIVKKTMMIFQ
jgi:hypothetical protein